MFTLPTNPEQPAGTLAGPPDSLVYAVVGFDGSASALHALDAASRLLNDRPGGMEIVYVAHRAALAAGGGRGRPRLGGGAGGLRRRAPRRARGGPPPPAGQSPERRGAALALPA